MAALAFRQLVALELLENTHDVFNLGVEEAHLHFGVLMQLEVSEEVSE